ncbi:MAG: hypothetical protein R8P61_36770 [Bacteroidia bacterium]|nr:hypothetical protein [Bacteroidia bacterium]
MIIPPNKDIANLYKAKKAKTEVYLEAMHLCIDQELSKKVFGTNLSVYLSLKIEHKFILLASVDHVFFKKMHESSQHMLKIRNAKGGSSVALHEILIDHDFDLADGALKYEVLEKAKILKVQLT